MRTGTIAAALVAIGIAAGATPAFSQTLAQAPGQPRAPDPARGRALAQRLCATCHVVEPGQAVARADVPAFASIARRPDATAEQLAGRIIIPHPAMPDGQLTVAEIRDIVAYILSLGPPR